MSVQSTKAADVAVIKLLATILVELNDITYGKAVASKVRRSTHVKHIEDNFADFDIGLFTDTGEFHFIDFFVITKVKLAGVKASESVVSILNIFDLMNLKSDHNLILHFNILGIRN
jgi:hypothetical protein